MLISSISFAFVNLLVKVLTNSSGVFPSIQDYPPYEIVFFRSIISLTICFYIIKQKKIPFFGHNKKWLTIRGVFGATALTIFFYTIKHLPIAVATTVQYLSPIFTVLFAIYLLNQKVKPIQWLFFIISLIGVALIGFGKNTGLASEIDPFWVVMGVISAVFSSVAYNAIMKCRTTDDPITVVMYFPLIATPIMIIIMVINGFVMPMGLEWGVLLLIGVFTQVAQIFMTKSFHEEDASKITPFKYLGAIYAVCIGVFIFDENLSLIVYLGIALILTGVLLNTFLKRIVQRIKQS